MPATWSFYENDLYLQTSSNKGRLVSSPRAVQWRSQSMHMMYLRLQPHAKVSSPDIHPLLFRSLPPIQRIRFRGQ